MTQAIIDAARYRHQDQQHLDPFETCTDPVCREATTEINKESAISAFKRGLRWVGFEKKPRVSMSADIADRSTTNG
jgi:hypothetical protein